jgi:hypothetical protein
VVARGAAVGARVVDGPPVGTAAGVVPPVGVVVPGAAPEPQAATRASATAASAADLGTRMIIPPWTTLWRFSVP